MKTDNRFCYIYMYATQSQKSSPTHIEMCVHDHIISTFLDNITIIINLKKMIHASVGIQHFRLQTFLGISASIQRTHNSLLTQHILIGIVYNVTFWK